eukprot:9107010-Pyramimonas_sp.AAC.1
MQHLETHRPFDSQAREGKQRHERSSECPGRLGPGESGVSSQRTSRCHGQLYNAYTIRRLSAAGSI